MAEKKDSIRNLIEQGRRAGKLTSTEISDAMEESSRVIDAEQMEKLYEELESNGIEVVACPGYVRLAYCVSYETIQNSLPEFEKLAAEYGL